MTPIRPDAHTLTQRATEAARQRSAELSQGAELVRELNGSTRRDIAEVWWAETRPK